MAWIKETIKKNTLLTNAKDWFYYQYWLSKYYLNSYGKKQQVKQPLRLYWIDPLLINKVSIFAYKGKRLKIKSWIGVIKGGEWDKRWFPIENFSIANGFEDRFNELKPWESTHFVQKQRRKIQNGKICFGCCSFSEFKAKMVPFYEGLYESIKKNGYLTQKELGRPWNPFGEIVILMDRNGDYQFVDGRHRFAVARSLRLKSIPVLILLRHQDYFQNS